MKILWLTNIPLPEASLLFNEPPVPYGGWLIHPSDALSNQEGTTLAVAFPKRMFRKVHIMQGERITYYAFPPVPNNDLDMIEYNQYLDQITNDFRPDLVHIFGTEYLQTLAMVNVCKKKGVRTVISIQGLVSIYARHYMAYLPSKLENSFTFRDLIKWDNLNQQRKKFIKRGEYETRALTNSAHIIGRTTWDKACTLQINPSVTYHHCNEVLRDEFYKHTWDITKCERHSIFVSQGSYPIKGLHFMLDAMPLVLKKFPKAKLYVGGTDITQSATFNQKLKITSYGKYIKKLIQENNMKDSVNFTGVLDERQMCIRYLRSHVFVCPSSIENSPNSLGEAMILGVPSVASNVGGVSDLINNKSEGFVYPADAPYMLAYYICAIFENDDLAYELSTRARIRAMQTHDRSINTKRMTNIYNSILVSN